MYGKNGKILPRKTMRTEIISPLPSRLHDQMDRPLVRKVTLFAFSTTPDYDPTQKSSYPFFPRTVSIWALRPCEVVFSDTLASFGQSAALVACADCKYKHTSHDQPSQCQRNKHLGVQNLNTLERRT